MLPFALYWISVQCYQTNRDVAAPEKRCNQFRVEILKIKLKLSKAATEKVKIKNEFENQNNFTIKLKVVDVIEISPDKIKQSSVKKKHNRKIIVFNKKGDEYEFLLAMPFAEPFPT